MYWNYNISHHLEQENIPEPSQLPATVVMNLYLQAVFKATMSSFTKRMLFADVYEMSQCFFLMQVGWCIGNIYIILETLTSIGLKWQRIINVKIAFEILCKTKWNKINVLENEIRVHVRLCYYFCLLQNICVHIIIMFKNFFIAENMW